MTPRVALIGANGFGVHHRRAMTPLIRDGVIRLVALCDVAPIADEPDAAEPGDVALFDDHRTMLDTVRPDVVILATPPHTHHDLAAAALRSGADVLVEKPPVLSMAEHESLCEIVETTGRSCQVGFQALGSTALAELTTAIRRGDLGTVTGIGAYGAWQRPDSYYTRTRWAGKRQVDGHPVLDGAAVNPFAHAVMQSLAIAEACDSGPIAQIEIERFRARPIEVDDTAAVRVRLASGLVVVIAVTLCADEVVQPAVVVHGETGQAVHLYKTDELRLPSDTAPREPYGRVLLLENLIAHRASPSHVQLLGDIRRTRAFTQIAEAFIHDSPPAPLAPDRVSVDGDGPNRIVTVPGVTAMVRDAASQLTLPSELPNDHVHHP